jgi:hypothetical protein
LRWKSYAPDLAFEVIEKLSKHLPSQLQGIGDALGGLSIELSIPNISVTDSKDT